MTSVTLVCLPSIHVVSVGQTLVCVCVRVYACPNRLTASLWTQRWFQDRREAQADLQWANLRTFAETLEKEVSFSTEAIESLSGTT